MKKLFLILVLELAFLHGVEAQGRTYTTNFSLTESAISESGNWINGQTVGIDWKNVRTIPGLAFGLNSSTGVYDDSTALLTGAWGPNQTVQATVHTVNQQVGNVWAEVEIRLRSAIGAHSNTGYEVNFSCRQHDGSQYVGIVRWNGSLGNFTQLGSNVTGPGLNNGDTVKATIVGSTITAYINGVQIARQTDSTYAYGNPGMGFFLDGAPTSANGDFGFTSFTASDGGVPPAPPTNLRIIIG